MWFSSFYWFSFLLLFFTEIDQHPFHLLSLFFHPMVTFFILFYCRKPYYYYFLETMENYDSEFFFFLWRSSVSWYIFFLYLCLCSFLLLICSFCARVWCYPEDIWAGMKTTSQVLENTVGRAGTFQSSIDLQHCLHLCKVLVPQEDFLPSFWSDFLQLKQSQCRLERSISCHKLSVWWPHDTHFLTPLSGLLWAFPYF